MEIQGGTGEYALVRVCDSSFRLSAFGLDAEGSSVSGLCTEFPANASTITRIQEKGFSVETVIADLATYYEERAAAFPVQHIAGASGFRLGSFGGYYTLEEIYVEFARMKEAFPSAVSAPERIGTSIENRPLYAYRISLAPENDSVPEALFTSLHHAREPGSVTAVLYFLWHYLENGSKTGSEEEFLLKHRVLWYIPVVNPDGYEFNRKNNPNGGGLWRKNRRNTGKFYGVDPNRNYGTMEYWNAPNGGSAEAAADETYRGESPFSEPETQAVRDFVARHRFRTALNYHTFGNVCIYPFSYSLKDTDDSVLYRNFAAEVTRKNTFSIGRDVETLGYAIRGGSDDYFYGVNGILSLTSESGARTDGFWARPDRIESLAADNLYANYQIVWSAGVNLRPTETTISWVNDSVFRIRVIYMNVGAVSSDSGRIARLSQRDVGISPLQQEKILGALAPGKSDTMEWEFAIDKKAYTEKNVEFTMATGQEGTVRNDTLRLYVRQPETLNLFVDGGDVAQWKTRFWGVQQTADGVCFADSPNAFYRANDLNTAEYKEPIMLPYSAPSLLSFWAKWQFSFKKDVAAVQVSTTNGRLWECLECTRANPRAELPDTLGGGMAPAFNGNFPLWGRQVCPLDKYRGKEILLRFAVGAEQGYSADGIALRNVVLHKYPVQPPDGKQINSDIVADIFPSPATAAVYVAVSLKEGQLPKDSPIEVRVYTPTGNMIFSKNLSATGGNETVVELPVREWATGVYFVIVSSQGVTIPGKIAVMH